MAGGEKDEVQDIGEDGVSEANDDDMFEEAVERLRSYSFVSIGEDGWTFEMHGLVQLATGKWLEMHGEDNRTAITRTGASANLFSHTRNWPRGSDRQRIDHCNQGQFRRCGTNWECATCAAYRRRNKIVGICHNCGRKAKHGKRLWQEDGFLCITCSSYGRRGKERPPMSNDIGPTHSEDSLDMLSLIPSLSQNDSGTWIGLDKKSTAEAIHTHLNMMAITLGYRSGGAYLSSLRPL